MTTDTTAALVAALEEELRAEGCVEPHGDIHAPRETFRGVVEAALSAYRAQSPDRACRRCKKLVPENELGDSDGLCPECFADILPAPPQEGERACCKRMSERAAEMAEHGGHYALAAHIRALAEEEG